MKKSALILLNCQIDYCPGGAMEVPSGDEIIPIANQLMPKFERVYAAIDWHPANHVSFAGNHPWRHIGQTIPIHGLEQELLPFHCVKESFGAHFYPGLDTANITKIIHQGTETNLDNYSCFYDTAKRRETGLLEILQQEGVEHLFFMGLATEGGVIHSVLDALAIGFDVFLIEDACRAWNKQIGDGQKAIKKMEKAGVKRILSERWV